MALAEPTTEDVRRYSWLIFEVESYQRSRRLFYRVFLSTAVDSPIISHWEILADFGISTGYNLIVQVASLIHHLPKP